MTSRLLYVTTSYPDIMISMCLCSQFQTNPISHVKAVNEFFYEFFLCLNGTLKQGMYFLVVRCFLVGSFDNDYVGSLTYKKKILETHYTC